MSRASLAQVGEGDPKVVAHPGFRELPECTFALTTKKAKDKYGEIGRLLFNSGRLTIDKHMTLSMYAMLVDQIEKIETEGIKPRASWFKQLQDAQRRLELDDLRKPIAAPKEAHTRRYARYGFPRRR